MLPAARVARFPQSHVGKYDAVKSLIAAVESGGVGRDGELWIRESVVRASLVLTTPSSNLSLTQKGNQQPRMSSLLVRAVLDSLSSVD